MCSISGFFNPYADYSANRAEYQQILKHMTTSLFHRGPDECGFALSKRCGLAHTRLSIIDLKTGSQPMVYETGGFSYQMIFNGEISAGPKTAACFFGLYFPYYLGYGSSAVVFFRIRS